MTRRNLELVLLCVGAPIVILGGLGCACHIVEAPVAVGGGRFIARGIISYGRFGVSGRRRMFGSCRFGG